MDIQIGELYKAKISPSEYVLVTDVRTIGNKKKTIFIKFIYCSNTHKETNGVENEVLIETFEHFFESNEHPDR